MVMVREPTERDRSRRIDDIGVGEMGFERGPGNVGIARHVLRLEEPEVHRLPAGDGERGAILVSALDHAHRRVRRAAEPVPLGQRPGLGAAAEHRHHGDVVRPVDHAPAREHRVVEVRRHDHRPHGPNLSAQKRRPAWAGDRRVFGSGRLGL
jgi:hypothetical protein